MGPRGAPAGAAALQSVAVAARILLSLLLLPLAVRAAPVDEAGRSQADLLRAWAEAGPEGRRRLDPIIERIRAAQRFSSARPVLLVVEDRPMSLAELFVEILDPALETPTSHENENDPGLQEIHRRALAAIPVLREAYAAPHPARAGTLNLLLEYAAHALRARVLQPSVRLRFLLEILQVVRELDGRVTPDATSAWLIRYRLLPALLSLAHRAGRDEAARRAIADAASLLYMPSILDAAAQAQLAPLATGVQSRDVLRRFYREGALDRMGRASLARSVAAQAHDDPAFAAGAPPLLLELLCDPALPAEDRGALVDLVLGKLADVEILAGTVRDLLAAAYGGPPRALDAYRTQRAAALKAGTRAVPKPESERAFRFLSIVLVQEKPGVAPVVQRVVRADLTPYRALYLQDGARRRFVGVLLPDADGNHVDFVGPAPGVGSARDHRLLRRVLKLERVSIRGFGARNEVIELCATLPEDASEPVPVRGAGLGDVLALLRARLRLTADAGEQAELVRLLVRLGVPEAVDLAVRHATTPGAVRAILPLAEGGNADAAGRVLALVGDLDYADRERALRAALAGHRDKVLALCTHDDVGIAALAADAMLDGRDLAGPLALLGHEDRYARAAAISLLLRVTKLAGGMRVVPKDEFDAKEIAARCRAAFPGDAGPSWDALAGFAEYAFKDPDTVRRKRRKYVTLRIGNRAYSRAAWVDAWTRILAAGEAREYWPGLCAFVLSPIQPGREIPEEHLKKLCLAIEKQLGDAALRRAWKDALVVLACAQYGIDMDTDMLRLAHERLLALAGKKPPPGVRRKPGIYWPVWAATER